MSFKLVASQFFLDKKKATSLSKEANAFCWQLVLIESLGMGLEALGSTVLPKLPLSANPHPRELTQLLQISLFENPTYLFKVN